MKTILIDVDDVICKNHFIPVINKYLNASYTEDDFSSIKFELELFPEESERNKFYDYFCSVDSYEDLPLKNGAYEVLQKLVAKSRVLLLTSAHHYERTLEMGRQFTDKYKFILKRLPFIPAGNVIFAHQKDVFVADVIIDDRMQNLSGKYKHKFLFTCFHNKDISDEILAKENIKRVNNWEELEQFLNKVI